VRHLIWGLLFFTFSSCSIEGDEESEIRKPCLFVVFAQQGDLHYAADDASEIYATLRKVGGTVVCLQATPFLHVDLMPLQQFLQKWKEGQMLVSNQSGMLFVSHGQDYIVNTYLQPPRYDATAETLTLEVTQVDPNQVLQADKISDVAMYIDTMAFFEID